MSFNELAYYIRLRIPDASTARGRGQACAMGAVLRARSMIALSSRTSIVMHNLNNLAVVSPPARGLQSFQSRRSYQILRCHDGVRLRAFFLSFDFDQRRAYFGGGVSNPSISAYCDSIDWDHTTVIARGGPCRLEAVAILTSWPPSHAAAELSIACPLPCCHEAVIAELVDLAVDVAALRYRRLIVSRELARPELLALLRENQAARFGCENIEIDLGRAVWYVGPPGPTLPGSIATLCR